MGLPNYLKYTVVTRDSWLVAWGAKQVGGLQCCLLFETRKVTGHMYLSACSDKNVFRQDIYLALPIGTCEHESKWIHTKSAWVIGICSPWSLPTASFAQCTQMVCLDASDSNINDINVVRHFVNKLDIFPPTEIGDLLLSWTRRSIIHPRTQPEWILFNFMAESHLYRRLLLVKT